MAEEVFEQQFSVGIPARLNLSNIRGSVLVLPVDEHGPLGGKISVRAIKHTDSGDPEHTQVRIEQAEDGSVSAETHFDEARWFFLAFGQRQPCRVDYTVQMPRNCVLNVNCVSSLAQVEGLEGNLNLKTVSGDITLRGISGEITAGCVSGAIAGEHLQGQAQFDLVSGSLRLSTCNLQSLHSKTVSGGVMVQTPLGAGPYRFHSVSGDVRLNVPADSGCEVYYQKVSGSFNTNLPTTRSRINGLRGQATLQNGGPEVRFDTTSGSLDIFSEGVPAAPAPPAAAETAAVQTEAPASEIQSPEEFARQVLDQLDRGEISAEEALKALQGK